MIHNFVLDKLITYNIILLVNWLAKLLRILLKRHEKNGWDMSKTLYFRKIKKRDLEKWLYKLNSPNYMKFLTKMN